MLPFSFLVWLLSFLDYYFDKFYQGSSDYIKQLVDVSLLDTYKGMSKDFIYLPKNQFKFTLKPLAFQNNLNNISILADLWFKYCELDVFFSIYKKYKNFCTYIILISQILCWYKITFFFFVSFSLFNFSGWDGSFLRSSAFIRPYLFRQPSQTYGIHRQYYGLIKKNLEGSWDNGHLVIANTDIVNPDNSAEVKYEGQPTSGRGTPDNPSYLLHPTKNFAGEPKPQFFVPPVNESTYIPFSALKQPPISGSKEYMEESCVKVNHAKHMPLKEET